MTKIEVFTELQVFMAKIQVFIAEIQVFITETGCKTGFHG